MALPSVVTPALLKSIRGQPQLPAHSWYFIAGVTLSVLNRPDEIAKIFKHAIEEGPGSLQKKPEPEEQLKIARRMREALVKAAPIGGLPRVCLLSVFQCSRHSLAYLRTLSSGNQCLVRVKRGYAPIFT